MSAPEHSYISSTGVRELIAAKADISKFVPKSAVKYFKANKIQWRHTNGKKDNEGWKPIWEKIDSCLDLLINFVERQLC